MSVMWTLHDSSGPVAGMGSADQALEALVGNHLEDNPTFLIGDAGQFGGTGQPGETTGNPPRLVRITIADE